jgi:hypothetical protein
MPIVPDTKDWTWVLERRCPECGYDARSIELPTLPERLRENASSWQRVLGAGGDVGSRPCEDRWSTLEYACHVRDVFRLFDVRLHLMLDEDDPTFANWDQDETAVSDRYGEQDRAEVSAQLAEAADRLASSLAAVSPAQLSRTGTRSDGARFSVESLGRYLLHDPVHHLHDVGA